MGALATFAFSPLGKALLAGAAFFVWLGFHDAGVANKARGECQAAQLRQTVQEMIRQRDAATAALAAAETQIQKTQAEMTALEKERDDTVAGIKKADNTVCRVPRAAIERLRNIR